MHRKRGAIRSWSPSCGEAPRPSLCRPRGLFYRRPSVQAGSIGPDPPSVPLGQNCKSGGPEVTWRRATTTTSRDRVALASESAAVATGQTEAREGLLGGGAGFSPAPRCSTPRVRSYGFVNLTPFHSSSEILWICESHSLSEILWICSTPRVRSYGFANHGFVKQHE